MWFAQNLGPFEDDGKSPQRLSPEMKAQKLIGVKLKQKIRTTQINKELKRQASLHENDPAVDAKRWGDVLMDPERCSLISFQGFLKLMKNGNVLSQVAQHLVAQWIN